MTLSKGNHLVKLDQRGNPIMDDREVYVQYEITLLSPGFVDYDQQTGQPLGPEQVFAVLRKVR